MRTFAKRRYNQEWEGIHEETILQLSRENHDKSDMFQERQEKLI